MSEIVDKDYLDELVGLEEAEDTVVEEVAPLVIGDLGALMDEGILGELSEEDELHEPGEEIVLGGGEEVGFLPEVGLVPCRTDENGVVTYFVPPRNDQDLRRETFRLVRDMKKGLDKLAVPIYRDHGLTRTQFEMLKELDLEGDLSASELARRLGLQRSNLATTAKKLIDRGYVVRSDCAFDRRMISLALTKDGRDVLESVEGELIAVFDMHLSASRRETFERIIEGMSAMRELLAEMKPMRL